MKHVAKRTTSRVLVALTVASVTACAAASETFQISSLELGAVEQEWGNPHKDQSVEGHGLSIGGQKFEHGLGTHAISVFPINVGGHGERFTAKVGVDDEVGQGKGSVTFKVVGDGRTLWESSVLHAGAPPKEVAVDLQGVKVLVLSV